MYRLQLGCGFSTGPSTGPCITTADTDSMQLDMDAADGTIEDDVSMRDEHTVHVPSQDETPDGGSVQTTTEPSSSAADPA